MPALRESAVRLASAGAELLCMPCNTAHHFYDQVADAVGIPILHMPRETAAVLNSAGIKTAGVLATDGTVQSAVYEKALSQAGIEAVYPEKQEQAMVMRLIYQGVKARTIPLTDIPVPDILRRLRDRGAEVFLLACTELPIAFRELALMEGCLDPTRVLAFAAVRACGGETVTDSPW